MYKMHSTFLALDFSVVFSLFFPLSLSCYILFVLSSIHLCLCLSPSVSLSLSLSLLLTSDVEEWNLMSRTRFKDNLGYINHVHVHTMK